MEICEVLGFFRYANLIIAPGVFFFLALAKGALWHVSVFKTFATL